MIKETAGGTGKGREQINNLTKRVNHLASCMLVK